MTRRPVGRAPDNGREGGHGPAARGAPPTGTGPQSRGPPPKPPPPPPPGRPHAMAHRGRDAATAPDCNRPPAACIARAGTPAGSDLRAASPPGRARRPRTPDSPEPEGPRQPAAGHIAERGAQGHPAAHPPPQATRASQGTRESAPPGLWPPTQTGAQLPRGPGDIEPPPDTRGRGPDLVLQATPRSRRAGGAAEN